MASFSMRSRTLLSLFIAAWVFGVRSAICLAVILETFETTGFITRGAEASAFAGPLMRVHVGLENVADLIADLEQGLAVLRGWRG